MKISDIRVEGRYRKEMGDIKSLAESINARGLLQPIVVDSVGRLLAGSRRLAAVQLLGWLDVDVRVIDTQNDYAEALRVEQAENIERKDMTPSEKVALANKILEMERPKAAERMAEGQVKGAQTPPKKSLPPDGGRESKRNHSGESNKIAAEGAGISEHTLRRAQAVVVAPDRAETPEQKQIAEETIKQMDAGDLSITAAHDKIVAAGIPTTRRQKHNLLLPWNSTYYRSTGGQPPQS